MKLADIHCHILPYIDDGAEHLEEMEQLLKAQVEQGVRYVCATPHMRSKMFESSDEAVIRQFERAKAYIKSAGLPLLLYLGREYYCDDAFLELLKQDKLICMGEGNTLLVEFSGRYSFETMSNYLRRVIQAGYQPLVAHVERYPGLDMDSAFVQRLMDLGAKIQINAGSILGREGAAQKRFCWKLLKMDLVHVVASDAHDPEYRPPELGLCAQKIERKMGKSCAKRVLLDNPLKILLSQ